MLKRGGDCSTLTRHVRCRLTRPHPSPSPCVGVSLASDAFFPFRDSLDVGARYGVSYILQPGGSNKDDEVVQAANEYGMAMATGIPRLFHH